MAQNQASTNVERGEPLDATAEPHDDPQGTARHYPADQRRLRQVAGGTDSHWANALTKALLPE
jgi:hypothetical protein